jgi:hypothetical protein
MLIMCASDTDYSDRQIYFANTKYMLLYKSMKFLILKASECPITCMCLVYH